MSDYYNRETGFDALSRITGERQPLLTEVGKVKAKYERKLAHTVETAVNFAASDNVELRMASRTIKRQADEFRIIVDALTLMDKGGAK